MQISLDNDQIFFEKVNCLICGSDEAVDADIISWHETEMHFVICCQCGLKYMQPRPTREWYAEFYKKIFWGDKVSSGGFSHKTIHMAGSHDDRVKTAVRKQQKTAKHILSILAPIVPLGPESVLMEFGASWGETLALFHREYGCKVFGVEPSELARSYAEKVNHIDFVGYCAEDMDSPQPFDGRIDLVIFSQVLENTIDPIKTLRTVRAFLKPDGFVFIETPNFYYHWNAANPYHPYIFNSQTLEATLTRAGFEPVKIICEVNPRQVVQPLDESALYLTVIAQPGPVIEKIAKISVAEVAQLIADQKIGFKLMGVSGSKSGMVSRLKRMVRKVFGDRVLNTVKKILSAKRD